VTTREQIIAAAMENDLVQFYAIAFEAGRVAEREECAKVCDTVWNGDADTYEYSTAANECAEAIRERNTK
jgi:hypothetical protein